MALISHILVCGTILSFVSCTTFVPVPVQTQYDWSAVSVHQQPSTMQGLLSSKLDMKRKSLQQITSWLSNKKGKKTMKYQGLPMTFVNVPKVEPEKTSEWVYNSNDWKTSDWVPIVPQKVEVKAPSSGFSKGSKFQKLMPLLSKSKKSKKFSKFQNFQSNWQPKATVKIPVYAPVKMPYEEPVHHSSELVHESSDFKGIYHIPTVNELPSYHSPLPHHQKSSDSTHSSTSVQNLWNEQYPPYHPQTYFKKSHSSFGEHVNYGAESNKVEIMVPPPSGTYAARVKVKEEQVPQTDKPVSEHKFNNSRGRKNPESQKRKEKDAYNETYTSSI